MTEETGSTEVVSKQWLSSKQTEIFEIMIEAKLSVSSQWGAAQLTSIDTMRRLLTEVHKEVRKVGLSSLARATMSLQKAFRDLVTRFTSLKEARVALERGTALANDVMGNAITTDAGAFARIHARIVLQENEARLAQIREEEQRLADICDVIQEQLAIFVKEVLAAERLV